MLSDNADGDIIPSDNADGPTLRYRLCGVIPDARTVAVLCVRSSSFADGEQPMLHPQELVWQSVEFGNHGVTSRIVSCSQVLEWSDNKRKWTSKRCSPWHAARATSCWCM